MNGTPAAPSRSKLQPALLGGVFMGVLASLPFISYANACCCLWVVLGGVIAAWLLQQNYPYAITTADGAIVGLLAGVVGALVAFVVGLLLSPFQRQLDLYMLDRLSQMSREAGPMIEQVLEQRRSGALNFAGAVVGLFVTLIVNPLFGMLGGLLGAALFRKNMPPPPATAFGSPADLPPAP